MTVGSSCPGRTCQSPAQTARKPLAVHVGRPAARISSRSSCARPGSEQAAKAKEMDATHLISKTVAEAFGTIMMDNYVLNRFLRKDAP